MEIAAELMVDLCLWEKSCSLKNNPPSSKMLRKRCFNCQDCKVKTMQVVTIILSLNEILDSFCHALYLNSLNSKCRIAAISITY